IEAEIATGAAPPSEPGSMGGGPLGTSAGGAQPPGISATPENGAVAPTTCAPVLPETAPGEMMSPPVLLMLEVPAGPVTTVHTVGSPQGVEVATGVAVAGPTKLPITVWEMVRLSLVSVPTKVMLSPTVSVTVNTTTPLGPLTFPPGALMLAAPPFCMVS